MSAADRITPAQLARLMSLTRQLRWTYPALYSESMKRYRVSPAGLRRGEADELIDALREIAKVQK